MVNLLRTPLALLSRQKKSDPKKQPAQKSPAGEKKDSKVPPTPAAPATASPRAASPGAPASLPGLLTGIQQPAPQAEQGAVPTQNSVPGAPPTGQGLFGDQPPAVATPPVDVPPPSETPKEKSPEMDNLKDIFGDDQAINADLARLVDGLEEVDMQDLADQCHDIAGQLRTRRGS